MVRIAGVNLPNGKHTDIALMYLYGVGRPLAIKILDHLGIEKTKKIDLLSEEDLDKIREELKNHLIE
jgi:small subunit ribosomal protein S13